MKKKNVNDEKHFLLFLLDLNDNRIDFVVHVVEYNVVVDQDALAFQLPVQRDVANEFDVDILNKPKTNCSLNKYRFDKKIIVDLFLLTHII